MKSKNKSESESEKATENVKKAKQEILINTN